MTDRIRRAFKMPRRESNEFVDEMRDARREALPRKKEALQNIRRGEELLAALQDGIPNYESLNQALFGRPSAKERGAR